MFRTVVSRETNWLDAVNAIFTNEPNPTNMTGRTIVITTSIT